MLNMLWKISGSIDSSSTTQASSSTSSKPMPLTDAPVTVHQNHDSDDTYEIEFRDQSINHLILEYHQEKGYIFVKAIVKTTGDNILRKYVRAGDILLSVNNHIILDDDIADITAYFDMLHQAKINRKLRILSVNKCSFNAYMEKTMIAHKSKKDMFGFNRTLDYLLSERQYQVYSGSSMSQRDIDWVEYLKAIGGPDNLKPAGIFKPSKELKALVRRGIPVAFRALVWQKISLSSVHRREFGPDYYQNLLQQAPIVLDSRVREDIEKDIDRTFPEHEYFGGAGDGENSLRRILVAYAVHNPDVGYCQSLNFVGGLMLLFMEEEDAFWLLLTIIETLLPKDYYTRTMIGTYTDQYVLGHLLQLHLPNVHKALDDAQLQLPLVTVQWFMCLFVNTLRPEIALRVWDIFLNEGSKALFRIAMALFKTHEKAMLNAKDAGELFIILRDVGRNVLDVEALIAVAYKSYRIPVTSNAPLSASSSSGHFTRVRRDSHTVQANPMQPPRDLTGLGLAHLGPIAQPTTSTTTIPTSSSTVAAITTLTATSISMPTADGSNSSDITSEESPDESGLALDGLSIDVDRISPLPYFSAASASATAKLKSRSTSFIRLDDGSLSECLVSDFSNAVKMLSASPSRTDRTSSSAKRGSFILSSMSVADIPLSFKRRDIEMLRVKFRSEVVQQFQDMEAARNKWKKEQVAKSISPEKKSSSSSNASNDEPDVVEEEDDV